MTILILKRTGLAMTVLARWEDGEWLDTPDDEPFRYADDSYFDRFSEEMMLSHFDGPDLFATTVAAFRGEDTAVGTVVEPFGDSTHARIVSALRPKGDEVVSSAWLREELEDDDDAVHDAVVDLIEWGELELVAQKSGAGRVVLNESVADPNHLPDGVADAVWLAYVSKGKDKRYAMRVFDSKSAAFEHFRAVKRLLPDEFERVRSVKGVWTAATTDFGGWEDHTAVVRCEAVQSGVSDSSDRA
ncbi:hypothetical protein [Haloarchaeobius sp. HME9146]|uniref:hypothetical protein n=1 Tax=Haloarchaeobius sp. HME9146 TaxID=2978732 RepID=UPI0021C1E05A|nr:hypothetical protein [Haloarchaeobius sp. HME9146]MCT9095484.1 hypothetical protein [Haloarchaeobius sp. HME9146]